MRSLCAACGMSAERGALLRLLCQPCLKVRSLRRDEMGGGSAARKETVFLRLCPPCWRLSPIARDVSRKKITDGFGLFHFYETHHQEKPDEQRVV